MHYFVNDYSEGAHSTILEALSNSNYDFCDGYGNDIYSKRAGEKIKKIIENPNVDIHYVSGGTQANRLCLDAFLKGYEAIIAVDSAHINVHEAGAIEATGHKIIQVRGKDGKISKEEILRVLSIHQDEHMVKPKLVFITDATEVGTVYTKQELVEISNVCHQNNLYLYLDGARLSNALCVKDTDLTLKDIAKLCDAFYLGGTKNGALLGEAIVITNDELKKDFRYIMKQNGAMLAKGRLIGIQFDTLLNDGLYLELANHANTMAQMIQDAIIDLNIPLYVKSATNQIFPILTNDVVEELSKDFAFSNWEKIDQYHTIVRFVCSWATKKEDILALIDKLKTIYANK